MIKDLKTSIGFEKERSVVLKNHLLLEYVNLKLAAMGAPIFGKREEYPVMDLASPLLVNYREQMRLLAGYHCPSDARIQAFLENYLKDVGFAVPQLPTNTFVLDRHGLARMLSLPPDRDEFDSDLVKSYRLKQGILHNPKNDRRTTEGSFHIAEGGLPIPADKIAVPKAVFGKMLEVALCPPASLLQLPFTASGKPAYIWTSLLLRPIVCPEVASVEPEKSMEIRFFAPGSLVSNLDFVESIFGNAGHPDLAENNAGLDPLHWTGHSGCVILAPHLLALKKKETGLPHVSAATDRQRRERMCWTKEDECYNDGKAFKLTARDKTGVIVTLIADNYFGYCKKEVKTQISFSANLYGQAEEEHSGGAIAFAAYDLGYEFQLESYAPKEDHTFSQLLHLQKEKVKVHEEGYATDRRYRDILYVPENAFFTLNEQQVIWFQNGEKRTIPLRPNVTYVLPSGYKVSMDRLHGGRRWRLVGTTAEGTFCHKSCTVSGGGKSEISKSISDAIIDGPVFVSDFNSNFDCVAQIIEKEYGMRYKDPTKHRKGRLLLSPERSLGSVIKLLTPSEEYHDAYNEWLRSIPYYIKELVLIIKRFYKESWGPNWKAHFSVDVINGTTGNELKFKNQKLIAQYLRIGFTIKNGWRIFGLRKDFYPAFKIQMEDDISASVVFPRKRLKGLDPAYKNPSVKMVANCEYRLFQRPDEAIHRGYDQQTELDLSKVGNFVSNFEPLTRPRVQALIEDTIGFSEYTKPMQQCLSDFMQEDTPSFCVSSACPRLVEGSPSKNPRYLQDRQDLLDQRSLYLARVGARLHRRLPGNSPIYFPVNAVLAGRRNNPPGEGIRSLAVYNPLHYLELPELFMEFICSITGKSPSTTGAGSEGALTKGPFNALPPITDLNNTLVSYLLTGYHGFVSSAGYLGPHCRVDHDISLLIPELWCRMRAEEKEPSYLIQNGYLEKCEDFEVRGRKVQASRLGYRITPEFAIHFLGRIFSNPASVLTEEMLRPEIQDQEVFVDGMDNIVSAHKRVALLYFEDGSIEGACPPLYALLHIMAYGKFEGKELSDLEIRKLFSPESLLESDWYADRLVTRQKVESNFWRKSVAYIESFLAKPNYRQVAEELGIRRRLEDAKKQVEKVEAGGYVDSLKGTLGTDPFLYGE